MVEIIDQTIPDRLPCPGNAFRCVSAQAGGSSSLWEMPLHSHHCGFQYGILFFCHYFLENPAVVADNRELLLLEYFLGLTINLSKIYNIITL